MLIKKKKKHAMLVNGSEEKPKNTDILAYFWYQL